MRRGNVPRFVFVRRVVRDFRRVFARDARTARRVAHPRITNVVITVVKLTLKLKYRFCAARAKNYTAQRIPAPCGTERRSLAKRARTETATALSY